MKLQPQDIFEINKLQWTMNASQFGYPNTIHSHSIVRSRENIISFIDNVKQKFGGDDIFHDAVEEIHEYKNIQNDFIHRLFLNIISQNIENVEKIISEMDYTFDLNTLIESGKRKTTCLHESVYGPLQIVKILCFAGADVNVIDNYGMNVIEYAKQFLKENPCHQIIQENIYFLENFKDNPNQQEYE